MYGGLVEVLGIKTLEDIFFLIVMKFKIIGHHPTARIPLLPPQFFLL